MQIITEAGISPERVRETLVQELGSPANGRDECIDALPGPAIWSGQGIEPYLYPDLREALR